MNILNNPTFKAIAEQASETSEKKNCKLYVYYTANSSGGFTIYTSLSHPKAGKLLAVYNNGILINQ